MDSVGGVVAEVFRDLYSVGGVVAEIFRARFGGGGGHVAELFPLTAVTDPKFVLFKMFFFGGGSCPLAPPSRTPMHIRRSK